MPSFSHPSIVSMASSPNIGVLPGAPTPNCLQQRDLTPPSPYQCHMSRGSLSSVSTLGPTPPHPTSVVPPPPPHTLNTYDTLGLGYTPRHSPCSPSQGYQMNGGAYAPSNSSSTGLFCEQYNPPVYSSSVILTGRRHGHVCALSGLISPGVSVPIAVPGQPPDMSAQYWSRLQWPWC